MTEALETLIDRINREGIEKAEQESAGRIKKAEEKAAAIIEEARKQAGAILEKAETDAGRFEERARKSLQQAARDTLLTVAKTIDDVFADLARRSVKETLDTKTMRDLLARVVQHYFAKPETQRDITLLIAKKDAAAIEKHLMAEFAAAAKKGLTIGGDDDLTGGFRVEIKEDKVFHDFSEQAIAQLFCKFLRPQLAAITRDAVKKAGAEEKSRKQ